MRHLGFLCAAATAGVALARDASYLVMMSPRSGGSSEVRTYDPFDGRLVHSSYINLRSLPPTISSNPWDMRSVGSELWVTDPGTQRINRFSQNGAYLGGFSMSGPRGMEVVGDIVYVAATNRVYQYDFAGHFQGSFATAVSSNSDVTLYNGELLVSANTGDGTFQSIFRYDLGGNLLGTFSPVSVPTFQVEPEADGNILVAGTWEFDSAGVELNYWARSETGAGGRGVFRLGNGNLMVTDSTGRRIFDPDDGTHVFVEGGSAMMVSLVTVPAPSAAAVILLASAIARRRR